VATSADAVGDLQIPRGSMVVISPFVLHRHVRLWRNPEIFDPSRFLDGAPSTPRFGYLPFGAGPRACVGAQFAMAEATLVLAMLIRHFELALADDRPVVPVAVVTTQPDHVVRFRLRVRRPTSL
jgi:cytochrome P450